MEGLLGVTSQWDHRPIEGGSNRSSSSEYKATYPCGWASPFSFPHHLLNFL